MLLIVGVMVQIIYTGNRMRGLGKKNINMVQERFCLMVPLRMPLVVELSTCMGVAGWGWPILANMVCTMMASLFGINKSSVRVL